VQDTVNNNSLVMYRQAGRRRDLSGVCPAPAHITLPGACDEGISNNEASPVATKILHRGRRSRRVKHVYVIHDDGSLSRSRSRAFPVALAR
jgi:hypothetical protein